MPSDDQPYIKPEEVIRNTSAPSVRFEKSVPTCCLEDKDLYDYINQERVPKTIALYRQTKEFTNYRKLPKLNADNIPNLLLEIHDYQQKCYNANHTSNKILEKFRDEVQEYGYFSIDTEGAPAQLLQMASPYGTVLYLSPEIDESAWRKEQDTVFIFLSIKKI